MQTLGKYAKGRCDDNNDGNDDDDDDANDDKDNHITTY